MSKAKETVPHESDSTTLPDLLVNSHTGLLEHVSKLTCEADATDDERAAITAGQSAIAHIIQRAAAKAEADKPTKADLVQSWRKRILEQSDTHILQGYITDQYWCIDHGYVVAIGDYPVPYFATIEGEGQYKKLAIHIDPAGALDLGVRVLQYLGNDSESELRSAVFDDVVVFSDMVREAEREQGGAA